jgi:hypothetical protein
MEIHKYVLERKSLRKIHETNIAQLSNLAAKKPEKFLQNVSETHDTNHVNKIQDETKRL